MVHASHPLQLLQLYQRHWLTGAVHHASLDLQEEQLIFAEFMAFASMTQMWFHRENETGHFTGSALVTNPAMTRVLLTHHRKLDKWLQLGGHADGDPNLHEVALRETGEESGLSRYRLLPYESVFNGGRIQITAPSPATPVPYDLDAHPIPERKGEPAHIHYDVRYVVVADESETPVVTEESHDVRWFDIGEARLITNERSMHRQFDKLEVLRSFSSGPYNVEDIPWLTITKP